MSAFLSFIRGFQVVFISMLGLHIILAHYSPEEALELLMSNYPDFI